MRCSSCGNILDLDDDFCGECGQPVQKQAPKPEPPPPPRPPAPVQQQSVPQQQIQQQPSPPPPPQFSSQRPADAPARAYAKPQPKKKKGLSGCWIAVIVLVVLGGCVGFGILGFGLLSPDIFNPDTGGGTTGESVILVENYSSETICELYISPNSAMDWGNDWLTGDFIGPGATITYTNPYYGETIDIALVDCDGYLVYNEYGFYVSDPSITITYYGQ